MPKKPVKPTLTLEQWFTFMSEQGEFWSTPDAREGLEAWYEYKKDRDELYTSTLGLRAIQKEFKDKEYIFTDSVWYRVNENKQQGLFHCFWMLKNTPEELRLIERDKAFAEMDKQSGR